MIIKKAKIFEMNGFWFTSFSSPFLFGCAEMRQPGRTDFERKCSIAPRSLTIPQSLRDSYLTTPVSLIVGRKALRQLASVGLRFVKTTLSYFYSLTFAQGSLLREEAREYRMKKYNKKGEIRRISTLFP